MKRISHTYISAALSTTGLSASVTGASWTPTTAVMSDGLAHFVTITGLTATNHSGKTAVITGTSELGVAQTETIAALPNGVATVASTKYWLSVTSIVPSATIGADTMSLGWNATSVGPWLPVANYGAPGVFNLGFVAGVNAGSPTYTVQGTYNDDLAIDHATVAAQTTTQEGAYTAPRSSLRVKFTAAGTVTLTCMVAHL